MKNHLLAQSVLLALFSIAQVSHAQREQVDTEYTVKPNDTLWLIATQHYDAPSAYAAIYDINRVAFESAYNRYVSLNPKFNKLRHPRGPNWIFPDTKIKLPGTIHWRDIPYQRRATPMNRDLAEKVASPEGINLSILLQTTREMLPSWVEKGPPPQPHGNHNQISRSGPHAVREAVPDWYTNPAEDLYKCAKAVCDRYKNLCYFECLIVSKRFD